MGINDWLQDMGLLLDHPLQRMKGRFVPTPLPPAGTFNGQTVLIVGATAGLGLAAAVHFANLGASVIITSRKASRVAAAKRHIEEATGPSRKGEIICLEVDLESYESCTGFMAKLKSVLPDPAALDVAIVSGGIVNSHWEESAAGWYVLFNFSMRPHPHITYLMRKCFREKTIQINTIGNVLIGLLLLGWMREGAAQRKSPAHMTFLSSREHLYPDINELDKWAQKEDGILRQVSSKENWPGGFWDAEPNYAISKLLLVYAIEEMVKLARGPDGE